MTNLTSEEITKQIADIDSEISRISAKPTMSRKVVELRGKKKKLQQALSKAVVSCTAPLQMVRHRMRRRMEFDWI